MMSNGSGGWNPKKKMKTKMKYIITESQYNLLVENYLSWLKRRVNPESMKKYITTAEINFPTLCDDFGDEFEYADNVIRWAVDDFLTSNEDSYLDEMYDEIHDLIVDWCKGWFGEYLFEIYRNTCPEEDYINESEHNTWFDELQKNRKLVAKLISKNTKGEISDFDFFVSYVTTGRPIIEIMLGVPGKVKRKYMDDGGIDQLLDNHTETIRQTISAAGYPELFKHSVQYQLI